MCTEINAFNPNRFQMIIQRLNLAIIIQIQMISIIQNHRDLHQHHIKQNHKIINRVVAVVVKQCHYQQKGVPVQKVDRVVRAHHRRPVCHRKNCQRRQKIVKMINRHVSSLTNINSKIHHKYQAFRNLLSAQSIQLTGF